MKQCLLGIAILLFAILLQLCSTGMEILTLIIGVAGLCVVVGGCDKKEDTTE